MMSDTHVLAMPSASLAFGLDWLPLINGRANRVVYRMARQYRATHLVFAGDTAASVGLATLRARHRKTGKVLMSAAQNVARIFPDGTVALLLELDPANYWLVAVHEGAVVTRTDRLYRSHADGHEALDELRRAYPRLKVAGDSGAPDAPALARIEAASASQARLQPVNRWRSVLPVPVQWFVLSLVIALAAPRFWQILAPVRKAAVSADPVDPVQSWQKAISKANRHRIVHGVAGTRLLLQSLYQLPTQLAGWALVQASCTAAQPAWRCHARYDRRHRAANNDSLIAAAPKNWTIQFTSMDRAEPTWNVISAGAALPAHPLRTTAYHERYLFSSLQKIKPAYSQIQFGKLQVLDVTAPRNAQGKAIPLPAGLRLPLARTIQIRGPLRSGSLLVPHAESIGWQKIVLSLHDTDSVDLTKSRISVSFQGVLYETQDAHQIDHDHNGVTANPAVAAPAIAP